MSTSRNRWAKNNLKQDIVPLHKVKERRKEIQEAKAKEKGLRKAFKGIYTYRQRKINLEVGKLKWKQDE